MSTYQSEVQDLTSRLKGSGVLEIAAYDADAVAAIAAGTGATDSVSWVNVGSVEGIKAKEAIAATQLSGDNAEEEKYASSHGITLSFNQREAMLSDARAVLRGSFDVSGTPVAGSLVEGAEQVIASGAWEYNTFIPIEHQNGSGAAVVVNSVSGSTNDTLVADTDYVVTVVDGVYGIVIIDSATITTLSQSMTIDYDYTPYASKRFYTGGKTTLPYLMARLTNTDEDGKLVRFWFFKGSIDDGFDFSFKKDNDSDPVVATPVSMTFILDTSITTPGKQLMSWYQERGL
jgi:hypothetical protein